MTDNELQHLKTLKTIDETSRRLQNSLDILDQAEFNWSWKKIIGWNILGLIIWIAIDIVLVISLDLKDGKTDQLVKFVVLPLIGGCWGFFQSRFISKKLGC